MPRQARKPTAAERNRRTQERIRKQEVQAPPASGGGGSLGFMAVSLSGGPRASLYDATTTPPLDVTSPIPFTLILESLGTDFTLTGSHIAVASTGTYRYGLYGRYRTAVRRIPDPATAGAAVGESRQVELDWAILPSGASQSCNQRDYMNILAVTASSWVQLTGTDGGFLNLISPPQAMAAGDYIAGDVAIKPGGNTNPEDVYSLQVYGDANHDQQLTMWIERLA